jgi:hypothetical protein
MTALVAIIVAYLALVAAIARLCALNSWCVGEREGAE